MGGEGPVALPVKKIIATWASVVVRRSHDRTRALDVNVRQKEAADLGLLLIGEGLAIRLIGELALRAGRGRRGRATLQLEAPGC